MGSYCSCSGSFKFSNDVIIPKKGTNDKIEESLDENSKEKQEKKEKKESKIKRTKTYSISGKPKRSDKKRTNTPLNERNSFFQVVHLSLNIKLFLIPK